MKSSRESILHHIKNLSFPRRTGSEGEERAFRYIADFFTRSSLDVEVQDFTFSSVWISLLSKSLPLIIPGIIILSALVCQQFPLIALAMICVVIFLFFIGTRWNWFAEKAASCPGSRMSRNIIAKTTAEHRDQEIVIFAHYDSKSQTIWIPIRIVSLIIFLMLSSIAIVLALMKIGGILSIGSEPIILLSITCYVFSLPHLFNLNRNRSPGAIDNASGAGIMLEIAHVIQQNHVRGMPSFTFVATGAEEEGLIGSINFMKRYAGLYDKKKTAFVNLDSVGAAGKIRLIDVHGSLSRKRSRALSDAFLEIARTKGIGMVRGGLPPGTGVDSFPISYRGFNAITLTSRTLSRALLSIHTAGDSINNIDAGIVEGAADCILSFASAQAAVPAAQKA